jgi:thiol-disulfide isomerase/thioredoxin
MRFRFFPASILALLLVLGCSSPGAKTPTRAKLSDPSDQMPLVLHQSPREQWESRNHSLPPLPEKVKPAPSIESVASATEVTETASSVDRENDSPRSWVRSGGAEAAEDGSLQLKGEMASTEEAAGPGTGEVGSSSGAQAVGLDQVSAEGLSDLVRLHKGQVLLVNMWGIDCGPCVAELPHLQRIYQAYKSKGLSLVAISSDVQGRWADVERFVRKSGFTFDVYLKAPGSDTRFRAAVDPDYAADPFTVIFDRKGNKVATVADALSLEEWNQVVSAVLDGKPIPITKPDVIRSFSQGDPGA